MKLSTLAISLSLFAATSVVAEESFVLEDAKFIWLTDTGLHWRQDLSAGQECLAFEDREVSFELPGRLRAYLQERLQGANITMLPNSLDRRGLWSKDFNERPNLPD